VQLNGDVPGLALMVAMQIVIFCVALKNSLPHALLCLIVPFYVYVYAKKDSQAKPFLLAWYLGIALLVAGVIASA
jgi:RsiW-degrading membrane proteinase PrsW (M82 family)